MKNVDYHNFFHKIKMDDQTTYYQKKQRIYRVKEYYKNNKKD